MDTKSQSSAAAAEVVTIDVHATKKLVKSGHWYVDVRTEEEFKQGHVDVGDADKLLNIPYMFNTPQGRVKNPQFISQISAACSKDVHLIVGCQSGVRSVYATTDLLKHGFKHVRNMGGGYVAWVDNGLPVDAPKQDL